MQTTQPSADKVYFAGTYKADHWAIQPYRLDDPKVIALAYYKNHEYAVYVNPTDKRGYRCIARCIDNQNMVSTINRDYTSDERIGLGLITQLVAEVFSRIVPIAQTAVAGNNSHKFDKDNGMVYLGHSEEPSFLHSHIFGRGAPKEYIAGSKLEGPVPGLNFDMMAKTKNEPGNEAKVKWGEGEMSIVVARLKSEISAAKMAYQSQGLKVVTMPEMPSSL